jgi:non-ribosomal peptide synthetase component F
MSENREQPMPTTNNNPILQVLVMDDMTNRLKLGIERYGTGLQVGNGRDMLLDAYEEALDLCVYLRGLMYERDKK